MNTSLFLFLFFLSCLETQYNLLPAGWLWSAVINGFGGIHSASLCQIHNRYEGKDISNHKRNLVIAGGVALSVIVSPVVAAVTVGQWPTPPCFHCYRHCCFFVSVCSFPPQALAFPSCWLTSTAWCPSRCAVAEVVASPLGMAKEFGLNLMTKTKLTSAVEQLPPVRSSSPAPFRYPSSGVLNTSFAIDWSITKKVLVDRTTSIRTMTFVFQKCYKRNSNLI